MTIPPRLETELFGERAPSDIANLLAYSYTDAEQRAFIADLIARFRAQRTSLQTRTSGGDDTVITLSEKVANQLIIIEALQGEIEHHKRQLEDCQSNLRTAESKHQNDIDNISDRLNHEAVERGWCAEYREVLADLNRSLNRQLKGLAKSGAVELTYTVTVMAHVENVHTEDDLDDLIENDYNPDRLGRHFDDYDTDIDGGVVRYSVNWDHSRSRVVS